MKKSELILTLLVTCILLIFISCNKNNDKELLLETERLIISDPDSAFTLIKSIQEPHSYGDEFYMNYQLLMIKIKEKKQIDISKDTIIFSTIPYFKKHSNNKKTAESLFYSGRVLQKNKKRDEAIKAYLEATQYAETVQDYELLGLIFYFIGELYEMEILHKKAAHYFKQSKEYFERSGKKKNEIHSHLALASSYFHQGNYSLALKESDKIIKYIENIDDYILKSSILKWVANIYLKTGNPIKARDYIQESLEIDTGSDDMFYKYMILQNIYQQMNLPDSALFYSIKNKKSILESDNAYLKAKYYSDKARELETDKKFEKALDNYKKYIFISDSIEIAHREKTILEVTEKYNNEKIKNEFNQLIIQKQYLIIILIILICICLFFTGLILYHKQKANEKILKIDLLEASINKLTSEQDSKEKKLRKLLAEKLNISKKVGLINSMKNKEKISLKQLNEIFLGTYEDEFNWNEFYDLLNELYDNYQLKLKSFFPELNDNEIQFCSLLKAGLDTGEISLLLSLAPITIRMKKTQIRKKINMRDGGDIIAFLENIIEKKEDQNKYIHSF